MLFKNYILLNYITMEGLRKRVRPENSFNRDNKCGSHYLETYRNN